MSSDHLDHNLLLLLLFHFYIFLVIALKIHISTSTFEAITEFPSFVIEDRGEIPIKVSCFTFIVFLDGAFRIPSGCPLLRTVPKMLQRINS